jgi:hypothetical protein
LVEARTRAEVQQIDAAARTETQRLEVNARIEGMRRAAESEAEVQHIKTEADIRALTERADAATFYEQHPALLRLLELETLRSLSQNANARIYVNFDGQREGEKDEK